jgi:SAM-dependent methyltransferase
LSPGVRDAVPPHAPDSDGLGSRRERAARADQSSAAAGGPRDREGPHAAGGARSLDVAADAPVGAGLLRPPGGRLGRARETRRAGALAALSAAVARLEVPPARALDLGTGTGAGALWLAREFPEARVTGLDFSEAMIEQARVKLPDELSGRVGFLVADAERLPFADGSFDLVTQISVPVFFDEVARVLAPGGYVVVVSSLGMKTPFHTPERTLHKGFRRRGIDGVATGTAGPGTFFLGRLSASAPLR